VMVIPPTIIELDGDEPNDDDVGTVS